MNLKNFKLGIDILARHYENPDGYHMGAEHDEFFMYATERPLSPTDVEIMREAGWRQEHWRSDPEKDTYDPSGGWACYV